MVIIEPSNVKLTSDHEDEFCSRLGMCGVRFGVSTNLRTFNLYRRDIRDGVRKVASIDLTDVIEKPRLTPQENDAILTVRKLERARFMKIEDITKYC
jgi:predicted neuraminidase